MIINIRGTSGSGKSTLVRSLMMRYDQSVPMYKLGRKQPIQYLLHNESDVHHLAVIGHYEASCGGCDTISKMDDIFELVGANYVAGRDVIFEGLLISADVKRTLQLHSMLEDPSDLLVLSLDQVPIETCIEGINDRRRARMGDQYRPVKPDNTISKSKGVISSVKKLRAAGVNVISGDRDQLLQEAIRALRLEDQA